jgi:hypothetical protein
MIQAIAATSPLTSTGHSQLDGGTARRQFTL